MMTETETKNILYLLQTIGEILIDKDATIRAKQYRAESAEAEVSECLKMSQENRALKEYVANLEAQVRELQDYIDARKNPAPNSGEYCETLNVSKVLEGAEE